MRTTQTADKPVTRELQPSDGDSKRLAPVPITEKRRSRDTKPRITTTAPDEIRRHNISDDELERLMAGCETEGQTGTFWGLVGAAVAALPSAGESLWNAYAVQPAVNLSVYHLIEVIIVVASAAGATMTWTPLGRRRNGVAELGAKIRARTAK